MTRAALAAAAQVQHEGRLVVAMVPQVHIGLVQQRADCLPVVGLAQQAGRVRRVQLCRDQVDLVVRRARLRAQQGHNLLRRLALIIQGRVDDRLELGPRVVVGVVLPVPGAVYARAGSRHRGGCRRRD